MIVSHASGDLQQVEATSSACLVKWKDYDLRVAKLNASIINGTVKNTVLHGTQLSCTCETEAGQWKNRKIFIQNILADIVGQCPKDENLVLISLGSDRLLTEYILGKTLIENGFCKISFFLVDPTYVSSSPDNLNSMRQVLNDFRTNIESVFLRKNKEHLSKDKIRFLSRCQNITKYFTAGAHVVVIESLPPYAELIKDMQKSQVPVKSPQDLIMGSHLVQSNQANTIAFVPKQYIKTMQESGANLTDSLPLAIFKCEQSNFYLDWGCKIMPNGNYSLSFTGEESYLKSYGISQDRIQLVTGENIEAKEWIPGIRNRIETKLSMEIESLKRQNSQELLSQKDLTMLLEKVKEVAILHLPVSCFFSADYVLDREVAMLFLSTNAGHHYRKTFSLMADADTGYKISVKEI